jgi:hypothetical protein
LSRYSEGKVGTLEKTDLGQKKGEGGWERIVYGTD